jgi:hypothetical protein
VTCDELCLQSIRNSVSTPPAPATTSSQPTAAALSQLDVDAKDWLDFNRLRVELVLARKFAALRAIKSGQAAPGPCNAVVAAAFALDDQFPRFGTALNGHPLINALIEASSKYTLAGNACALYVDKSVRRYFDQGDAFIRAAQREAKRLKTPI